MTDKQAKSLIKAINKARGGVFLKVVDVLYKLHPNRFFPFNEFEFSFVAGNDFLRFLHLLFWKPSLTGREIRKFLKKRGGNIKKVFSILGKKFNCRYNLNLYESLLKFNRESNLWPMQFGLEYDRKEGPKVKIYLSINGKSFSLEKFCITFKLNYKKIKKVFYNKKFDAIAVDFLPNGKYFFKFYPLSGKNKGLLFRMDKNSKIFSVKTWQRFPGGLSVKNKKKFQFMKLPDFIFKFIKDNNLKIHYLCEENGKKSIYFR